MINSHTWVISNTDQNLTVHEYSAILTETILFYRLCDRLLSGNIEAVDQYLAEGSIKKWFTRACWKIELFFINFKKYYIKTTNSQNILKYIVKKTIFYRH